jgi:DNA repair photolyase
MMDSTRNKSKVSIDYYEIKPPLIKPSALTASKAGKELSDGYALNYAIGCTHACRFCYVDSIHRRFTRSRLLKKEKENEKKENGKNANDDATADASIITDRPWGMYMLIPTKESFWYALMNTEWYRCKDVEVMLSSTHDPYLPELYGYTRKILEASLPYGVRYCIQTRSLLVRKDFDLLLRYKDKIRLQYSIMTLNLKLSRLLEPRVPSPYARLNVLKEASTLGLKKVGVIIAPIFPIEGWKEDLEMLFKELATTIPNITVYGEVLHRRGSNLRYIKELGISILDINLKDFDRQVGSHFEALLSKYSLKGKYWYEQ